MSVECGICERDLRGEHDEDCPRHSSNVIAGLRSELAAAKRQYLEADGQYHECLIERDQLAEQLAKGGQKSDLDRIARAMYPHKSEGFTYTVDFIIDEIARAKRREAELTAGHKIILATLVEDTNKRFRERSAEIETLEIERDQLTARVKTLEDALKAIATSKSTWNSFAKQALAAKEPK